MIKVIITLKSRVTLIKGTTRKINSQEGGVLKFYAPLTSVTLPSMKDVVTQLVKRVLVSLGLMEAVSAAVGAIQNVFGSGTILIIFNKEMDDIMKIVKYLEESGLLTKVVNETIENEAKGQNEGILNMLLGTLATSDLRSALESKRVI